MDCKLQSTPKYYRFILHIFDTTSLTVSSVSKANPQDSISIDDVEKYHNGLSERILFIFIGNWKKGLDIDSIENLTKILQKIVENKVMPTHTDDDYKTLLNHYGEGINSWEINNQYKNIHFVENLINEYDTLREMISISSKSINQIISNIDLYITEYSSYYYTDSYSYIDEEYINIEETVIKYYEIYKKQITTTVVQNILQYYLNVPKNIINDSLPDSSDISLTKIKELFKNTLIIQSIKQSLKYKSLSNKIIDNTSKLELKLIPFIEYYLSKTQYEYSDIINITSSLKLDETFSNELIINNTEQSTINILSFRNITKTPYINTDSLYNNLFSLHLKPIADEAGDFSEKSPVIDSTFEQNTYFTNNLKIKELFSNYSFNCPDTNNKILLLNMNLHLNIKKYSDLKKIFDNIKLSYDIPIIKFKDKSLETIIYKIYKPITHTQTEKDIPIVPKKILNDWIKYNTITINKLSVEKKKGYVKGLIIKLKVFEYIKTDQIKEGTIIDIFSHPINGTSYNIKTTEGVYQKIEISKIKSDSSQIESYDIGSIVEFYKSTPLYAHIEIYKSGDLVIYINTETVNLSLEDIDEITIKLQYFIKNHINTIPYINQTNIILKNTLINKNNLLHKFISLNTQYNFTTYKSLDLELINKTLNIFSGFILRDITNEDVNYLTLLFRLNCNNDINNYIKYYISYLIGKNEEKTKIIDTIVNKFYFTREDIEGIYSDIIANPDKDLKLSLHNFPKIKIDYKNSINISDKILTPIIIENVNSDITLTYIIKFLHLLQELYDFTYLQKMNSSKIDEIYDSENLNKHIMDYLYNKVTDIVENSYDLDIFDDLDESGNILDEKEVEDDGDSWKSADSDDLSDLEDDDAFAIEVDQDIGNPIGNPVKIIQDTVKEIKVTKRSIIENLKRLAPELTNFPNFARRCQSTRQPIVLTDEYKTTIDNFDILNKNSSNSPGVYKFSYGNRDTDTKDCDINYPDKLLPKKSNACAAIKLGPPENKKWFVCPKIYNADNGASKKFLLWNELIYFNTDGSEYTFNPKNDSATTPDWYIDTQSGKNFKNFLPIYIDNSNPENIIKYGFKNFKYTSVQQSHTNDSKIKQTLLFRDKHLYPGIRNDLLNNEPCCYTSKNHDFTEENETGNHNKDYLINNSKILEYGQRGLLSDKLYDYLGDKGPHKTGKLKKTKYFKQGLVNNNNKNENILLVMDQIFNVGHGHGRRYHPSSALELHKDLPLILKVKEDIILRINRIRNQTKHNQTKKNGPYFENLNNGFLLNQFKTTHSVTAYQNFIEYILSNELKRYEFFYEYYNDYDINNNIDVKRFVLIIEKVADDFKIIIPYFSKKIVNNILSKEGIYNEIIVLIKNDNIFEQLHLHIAPKSGDERVDSNFKIHYKTDVYNEYGQVELSDKNPEGNSIEYVPIIKLYSQLRETLNKSYLKIHDSILYKTPYKKLLSYKKLSNLYKKIASIQKIGEEIILIKDSYHLLIGIRFKHKNDNIYFIPIYPRLLSEQITEIFPKTTVKLDIDNIEYSNLTTFTEHQKLYISDEFKIFDIKITELYLDENKDIVGFNTNRGGYIKCLVEKYQETNKIPITIPL